MKTIEVIGIAAGACTSISLLPQLMKIIKEKRMAIHQPFKEISQPHMLCRIQNEEKAAYAFSR